MMRFKKFLFILLIFSHSLWAEVDFYLISDFHGSYDQFEDLVSSMSEIRQSRRGTPAILSLNGDSIFGMGPYTDYSVASFDNVGMKTAEAFSHLGDEYYIVSGLGNHDSSDFAAMHPPEELLMRQVEMYTEMLRNSRLNSDANVVVANLQFGKKAQEKMNISTHRVLKDSNGQSVRAVSMVLESFFDESNFSRGEIIKYVTPLLETAVREIKEAKKSNQDTIVFFIHERSGIVENFIRQLNKWRQAHPEYQDIKIPFVQAAHDHISLTKRIGSIFLFNAGAMGEFAQVTLDDEMNISSHKVYGKIEINRARGKNISLAPSEKKAVEIINREIRHVSQSLLKPLGTIDYDIPENRSDLKKGLTPLGQGLASSLMEYGKRVYLADRDDLPEAQGFVGLWNSGNDRLEENIPAGPITVGLTQSINPSDIPQVVLLKGHQLQWIYRWMRKDRIENKNVHEYTPQISSNLIEKNDYTLYFSNEAFPDPEIDSHWRKIDDDKIYVVTTQFFIFNGAFGYEEVKRIFSEAHRLVPDFKSPLNVFNQEFILSQLQNVSRYYGQERAKNICLDLVNDL